MDFIVFFPVIDSLLHVHAHARVNLSEKRLISIVKFTRSLFARNLEQQHVQLIDSVNNSGVSAVTQTHVRRKKSCRLTFQTVHVTFNVAYLRQRDLQAIFLLPRSSSQSSDLKRSQTFPAEVIIPN